MTKHTKGTAAGVVATTEHVSKGAAAVQLAVPILRSEGRWFRHYALDHSLSMAELIRRILREFMATHGGPAE
jgi:hypothetical protein